MRKLFICLPTSLLLASVINHSNYRSYYDTIYKVQTIDFNMLANSLPTKLSLALTNKNKKEIQHTINSNYGYFGIVVTNCLKIEKECQGETIIAKSQPEKSGWKEKAIVGKLSSYHFDLLRNPPPMTAETKFKNARDKASAQSTGRINNGQIIGRVYYIRRDAPVDFISSLREWIGHAFQAIQILITTGSVERANIEWEQFLDYGANKFYVLTNAGAVFLGLFIWQWWKRSEESKFRLEKDVNYLKHENFKLKEKTNQLQSIVKKLKDQERSIEVKKKLISNDLDKLIETRSDFQEQIENKDKEIEIVSSDLIKIQDRIEIARHLEQSTEVIDDLEDQMQVTLLSVEQLQGERDILNGDMSLLQENFSNKEIDLQECQSDLNEAISQLKQAESQISSLQEQIINSENLLENNQIHSDQILQLQIQLSQSADEIDQLIQTFAPIDQDNTLLKNRIRKIKKGIFTLKTQNKDLKKDNQCLSKTINDCQRDKINLHALIPVANQTSRESLKVQKLSFSFQYYQDNHDKFNCRNRDSAYFLNLLERLKSLSSQSSQELRMNLNSTLRCHSIKWSKTTENNFGFPNEQQLVTTPYQFSISANEYGRVHGFFIDDVFYIVWVDPDHLLYQ